MKQNSGANDVLLRPNGPHVTTIGRIRFELPDQTARQFRGCSAAGLTRPGNRGKQGVQIENKIRIMARQMTAGEDIAMRRKKLRYRAWHRGTKEMDLILGPYADAHTEALDEAGLDRLEALMSEEDPPLLTWVMGQVSPPGHIDLEFLAEVIADHHARLAK